MSTLFSEQMYQVVNTIPLSFLQHKSAAYMSGFIQEFVSADRFPLERS
jgi:hypothetical protein